MKENKLMRTDCVNLLVEKYRSLRESGEDRYPQRSDFSEREIVAIKAFLGPWPRALEAAGIKPPRNDGKAERNREKHLRARRARTSVRKTKRSDPD